MASLLALSGLLAQTVNGGGGGGSFFVGIPCVFGLVALAQVILWIWALVDAIQNPLLDGSARLLWVIVIILLPLLGSILYLVIGRKA